jgi:hypothetical protein
MLGLERKNTERDRRTVEASGVVMKPLDKRRRSRPQIAACEDVGQLGRGGSRAITGFQTMFTVRVLEDFGFEAWPIRENSSPFSAQRLGLHDKRLWR